MAKRDATSDVLAKGDAVICARDLREVAEGTEGKVVLVVGLTWIRYWVRFQGGVAVGSLNRKDLATPAEWERRHDVADDAAGAGAAATDDGEAAATDGGGYTHAGVLVPQKLIDRSQAARQRLGA